MQQLRILLLAAADAAADAAAAESSLGYRRSLQEVKANLSS